MGADGPLHVDERLTSPALAADPLSSVAEQLAACAAGADLSETACAQRRLWCKSHNGMHEKYQTDSYMSSSVWAQCEARRLVGDTLTPGVGREVGGVRW